MTYPNGGNSGAPERGSRAASPTARSPLRVAVERFMQMAPTDRLTVLNDVLGGGLTWQDDLPAKWPALLAKVREQGKVEQFIDRVHGRG